MPGCGSENPSAASEAPGSTIRRLHACRGKIAEYFEGFPSGRGIPS